MTGPIDKSPQAWAAWTALTGAFVHLVEAEEKCVAAEYGSEVMAGLEQAREGISYALALIEGRPT